jgi:hypothetical protein
LAVGSWQLAVGSWQLAVGSWQLAVGSWQGKIPKNKFQNPSSSNYCHLIISWELALQMSVMALQAEFETLR